MWLRWYRICQQCRRQRFDTWVGKIPWRRAWQPTPVFLPGESHGLRSLVGYSPWGHKESDTNEQLTVEVTNRFKRLDLIGRVPEELWIENIVQEMVIKTIPKKKKCKRAKWLSDEALQIAEQRRSKRQKEKRKHISI